MMCCSRNKQKLYYATLDSYTESVDSNGYKTGEITKVFSNPVETCMNVAPASGNARLTEYGINEGYTVSIVTDYTECPITESTILWIGVPPYVNSILQPHNYEIIRVARSLNSITYTAKQVKVT